MILLMLDSVLKTMGWMLLMSVLSHTILAMLASFTAASCAGVSLVRGSSPFSYQNLDNQSPLGLWVFLVVSELLPTCPPP